MRTFSKPVALSQARQTLRCSSESQLSGYGRAASHRRIHSALITSAVTPARTSTSHDDKSRINSNIKPISARSAFNSLPNSIISQRPYTTSQRLFQQAQQKQASSGPAEVNSQAQKSKSKPSETTSDSTAEGAKTAEAKDGAEQTTSETSDKQESEGKDKESEGEEKDGKGKNEDAPPPPHGDKTPWQVFMETLNTEFKQSKEWNEGTKALSSGYDEVASNPALQKAKAAYQESLKATSSTAAAAAKVVGKGASAVWESPVAKVARKGASVAADGLDKATKPVRDTKAFKSIKETIDDGSSSRYGGWIEQEERKRRRALREAEFERSGGRREKMVEDEKYA